MTEGSLWRIDPSQPSTIDRLEEIIVRVTTWVSLVFFAVIVGTVLISDAGPSVWEAINPAVPAVAGIYMLTRGTPRVLGQLVPGGITVALMTGFADFGSRSGALLGLLSMGIVGALMVRRYLWPFLGSAAIGLFAVAYWWNVGDWGGGQRIAEALVPMLAFIFAAGLVAWLKLALLQEADQRERATVAMAASEQQFRLAFETSAAMMGLISIEGGRFLKVNQAGCDLLGYTEDELLAFNIEDLVHPEDRLAAKARSESLLTGVKPSTAGMIRYLPKNGATAYGYSSTALVTNGDGEPLHFVTQLVDMTEQHEAESRLMDLVAARDELIASVSHELRTPLTAMLGYADLLLESAPGEPPDGYADMLREIVGQGRDLGSILEDLLVFAQSDVGSARMTPVTVDVRDQVTLVLESLKGEMSIDHVEIIGPRVAAFADPLRVRQILRNLFTNAFRYGGDSVVISMASDGDEVSLTVMDDGDGIPPEDRDRIFEPYQRAQPKGGLTAAIGVGLTVARRLARLMDGDLTYSYNEDMSTFALRLPKDKVHASS
jgi:PAS domain S-box-containing protein